MASMVRKLVVVLTAPSLALAAGCGDDGNTTAKDPTSTASEGGTSSSLRPAEEARGEAELEEATEAAIGESAEVGPLNVTVTGFSVGGDDLGPWLVAEVRAENPSGQESSNPNFGIICTGSDEEGGWQVESTFRLGDTLPPGTVDEGTVNLLLPEDSRTGDPVPECQAPAFLRASSYGVVAEEASAARWPIPDELIGELNTKRLS